MRARLIPLALAIMLPGFAVQAGDFLAFGGAALTFSTGSDSGTRQDLNAYVEGEFSGAYAGVSLDIYNGSSNDEIDPYFGYRSETASGVTYDVSYTRYIYPNDGGDCCGDLNLSLGIPLGDKLTAGVDANYYPEDELSDVHLSMDIAVTDLVTVTGKYGLAQQSGGGNTTDWELAAAYQLGDTTAVKLHYYDGEDFKPYLALDLTWDVTLLGQ